MAEEVVSGGEYGSVGASETKGNEETHAPQTQEEVMKQGQQELHASTQGERGKDEIGEDEATKTYLEKSPGKEFVYKRIYTSSFCMECGRRAEYFAVLQADIWQWEKYLCPDCLKKEQIAIESGKYPSQAMQAAALKHKNEELKVQYEGLQQQSQQFGEAMGQKDEEIAKKEQEESQKPDEQQQQQH